MVSKIEDWHAPVAAAKHELFDLCLAVGNALFLNMCPQFPKMGELVYGILETWVEAHVSVLETRIDESFKQEEDPFVSTDELANEIVKVRSERFDRALAHVLKMCSDEAVDGVLGKAAASSSSSSKNKSGKVKVGEALKPLESTILDKLGQWYMANHGVSAAAQIEDMRTVLTAYWRLSSKRLSENVCMAFEVISLLPPFFFCFFFVFIIYYIYTWKEKMKKQTYIFPLSFNVSTPLNKCFQMIYIYLSRCDHRVMCFKSLVRRLRVSFSPRCS